MAAEAHPPMPGETLDPAHGALIAALCQISETYGRGICREPQRVAAMLRDLCPDRRRESFLLVSALKENVVADLLGGLDSVPEDILVARGALKLRENLGLTEVSARWAVESWIPACRILYATPERPLRVSGGSSEEPADAPPATTPERPRIDWVWLGCCAAAMACAAALTVNVGWFAFHHYWNSLQGWLAETGLMSGGLAASAGGLYAAARQFRGRKAPDQRLLDVNRSAAAMLVEVAALLTLPLAPVLSIALWAAEWIGALHVAGQPHDLTFQLGRILQTLVIGLFLYFWMKQMITIQGRIASSMVRSR